MDKFSKDFKKAGGFGKIREFARQGVLGTVAGEVFLLGKSHKALEIANLASQYKVHRHLKKRYGSYIGSFRNKQNLLVHKKNKIVWICWLQGIENASHLVRQCYETVKKQFADWKIIVITSENLNEYTHFPDYISEKWKKGIISNTHFSDLLRLELLTRHGGLWLDATVYCTGKLPEYIENTPLFMYQSLKPGFTGHTNRISSWLIWAESDNIILLETKRLLFRYWKNNDILYDYFILHHFITMVLENYPEHLACIIPVSNEMPHILLLRLFEKFDPEMWEAVKKGSDFHKLTYKFTEEQSGLKDTYYQKLFVKACPETKYSGK